MNHEMNKIQVTRVLPIMLGMMPEIVHNYKRYQKSFRNCNFEYLCFVGRIVNSYPDLLISDETGAIAEQIYKDQQLNRLKQFKYYQCICRIRDQKIEILNFQCVDGNKLTGHFIKVIKCQLSRRAKSDDFVSEYSQKQEIRKRELESLYWAMKQWAVQKQKFTIEQLQQTFIDYDKNQFNSIICRFQQEQFIGNMGTHYLCL